MAVAYSMVDALKRAGQEPDARRLLRGGDAPERATIPFMRPGIEVKTSPRDYFPISDAQFLRYKRGHWRQVGR